MTTFLTPLEQKLHALAKEWTVTPEALVNDLTTLSLLFLREGQLQGKESVLESLEYDAKVRRAYYAEERRQQAAALSFEPESDSE